MGVEDFDAELQELVEELIDEGELDPKSDAAGVARQAIAQGRSSLSPAQRTVFAKQLVPLLRARVLRRHQESGTPPPAELFDDDDR